MRYFNDKELIELAVSTGVVDVEGLKIQMIEKTKDIYQVEVYNEDSGIRDFVFMIFYSGKYGSSTPEVCAGRGSNIALTQTYVIDPFTFVTKYKEIIGL